MEVQTKREQTRARLMARFSRIEGQVRGIHAMLEQQRDCLEILKQIAAVNGAINGAARAMIECHLGSCLSTELNSEQDRDKLVAELLNIFKLIS